MDSVSKRRNDVKGQQLAGALRMKKVSNGDPKYSEIR